MKTLKFITTVFIVLGTYVIHVGCQAQAKQKQMETKTNPLICDPTIGACEMPGMRTDQDLQESETGEKPVKIIYYTDPICSSCWGIEPQLRRLKLEYGHIIEFDYRMGGLLPDWSYNSGGISKPSDVAHHWDEVSLYYQMPIDGDVWLEDPLSSSYPPSIAFKAAQMQSNSKAIIFLRELRELLFLKKKNITKWEYVELAAKKAGLDSDQLKKDYERGKAKELFEQDLSKARAMGVRGFPSIFITDGGDKSEFVYGAKAYDLFAQSVEKIYPQAQKKVYKKDWASLFEVYPTFATREYAELSDQSIEESAKELELLVKQGKISKLESKNGPIWMRK